MAYEPTRGGTRGGKDNFDWEDVKVDKYRENYLGHSLKAPIGRWQKGRDLTWYVKESKVSGKNSLLQKELTAVKKAEEEAMARALGLKTAPVGKTSEALSSREISEVCKRRNKEELEVVAEKIEGVGFRNRRLAMMGVSTTTTKDGATAFQSDPSKMEPSDRLVLQPRKRLDSSISSEPSTGMDHATPTTPTASGGHIADVGTKMKKEKKKHKKESSKKRKEKKSKKSKHDRHAHSDDSSEERRQKRRRKDDSDMHVTKRRHDTDSEDSN